MNNYKIATALGIAALIIPAGIALAEDGHGLSGSAGIGISQTTQLGVNTDVLRGDVNEHANVNASTSANVGEHGNATSSERNDGQQGNTERGTHASSSEASSSNEQGNGIGRGGIVGFFRWLFGLPATTTVGDIRTQIDATTTASTTITTTSASQGLGFWARLFSLFRFGN